MFNRIVYELCFTQKPALSLWFMYLRAEFYVTKLAAR